MIREATSASDVINGVDVDRRVMWLIDRGFVGVSSETRGVGIWSVIDNGITLGIWLSLGLGHRIGVRLG